MSDEKKKKHKPESRVSRFLWKYLPRLYFASILLFVIYLVAVIIISRIARSDQYVYYNSTLWILWLAGLGMFISGVLHIFLQVSRGILMLMAGGVILICNLTLLGPAVSHIQSSVATLRQGDYVYRIAPAQSDSSLPELTMLQCDSLGIICDRIDTEDVNIGWFWGSPTDTGYQLQFDEPQNRIFWLDDGDIIFSHELE